MQKRESKEQINVSELIGANKIVKDGKSEDPETIQHGLSCKQADLTWRRAKNPSKLVYL